MTDAPASAARRAQSSPAARIAARTGFAMNGLLNAAIGVIAIGIAVSGASGTADPNGALTGLAQGPGGQLIIWVIAVGMLALGLWQLASATLVRETDSKKRLAARVKLVGKGIAYLAIGVIAARIALSGGSGGGGGEESFTATALATPGGVVLVVLVGLGALGVGVYMVVKGVRRTFLDDLTAPSGTLRAPITVVGVVGYVARGIAFAVIGVLFIAAAVTADASQAGGLDDALAALAALPYGQVVLVAIGVGFIAYGIYSVVRARYAKL